jgi:predicted AlkP superfamily pyrophosphatase or phosphodiesterase
VAGLPQSATGQAVLLTGRNVPALLGYHYGPKPNQEVAEIVSNGNLFALAQAAGKSVDFLNAYPPGYFEGIHSGRRMYAAIALAAANAGLRLHDLEDLRLGRAMSADFTGEGLRTRLGIEDLPTLSAAEAGRRLAGLGLAHDFSLFEYWLTDYAGHGQEMPAATALLEAFDATLAGLLDGWDDEAGLILLTSDHGNLEDLSTRRHTFNPVPALVIGAEAARRQLADKLHALTDIQPGILEVL